MDQARITTGFNRLGIGFGYLIAALCLVVVLIVIGERQENWRLLCWWGILAPIGIFLIRGMVDAFGWIVAGFFPRTESPNQASETRKEFARRTETELFMETNNNISMLNYCFFWSFGFLYDFMHSAFSFFIRIPDSTIISVASGVSTIFVIVGAWMFNTVITGEALYRLNIKILEFRMERISTKEPRDV